MSLHQTDVPPVALQAPVRSKDADAGKPAAVCKRQPGGIQLGCGPQLFGHQVQSAGEFGGELGHVRGRQLFGEVQRGGVVQPGQAVACVPCGKPGGHPQPQPLGVLGFSFSLPATRLAVPELGAVNVGLGRAVIAGVLGFGGIAGYAVGIAKILFFVFVVLFIVSLVAGLIKRGP